MVDILKLIKERQSTRGPFDPDHRKYVATFKILRIEIATVKIHKEG